MKWALQKVEDNNWGGGQNEVIFTKIMNQNNGQTKLNFIYKILLSIICDWKWSMFVVVME